LTAVHESQDNLIVTYDTTSTSGLSPFIVEPTQGNRILRAADLHGRHVGTLRKWSLELDTGS
jgi:subtilisin-like proprotein convertase family protein